MLIQTSIYSLILKITASNFQVMLLSDSTLQRQHKLSFNQVNHKVPFVISWPMLWVLKKKRLIETVLLSTNNISFG